MVSKSTILSQLAKKGNLAILDYPFEMSKEDELSYTDGTTIFIGQYKEFTFDDIYPIIMHEYYHCRLQHFKRVEQAKTPLMQFLHNISMDIEINEYLITKGISSKYFLDNGQFKNKNSLNIEIPANLHTFEEILAYIMKKLPKQKVEALNMLSKSDFKALGADLMVETKEVEEPYKETKKDIEQPIPEPNGFGECQETVYDPDLEVTDNEVNTDVADICTSLSQFGIQRNLKLNKVQVKAYKLSWTKLLRKFTGKLKGTKLDRTYQRPRRFGNYGRTILPAFKNVSGTIANLDIYIDVSGSMYPTAIKKFIEAQKSLRQLSTETRITYYVFNEKVFPIKYKELSTMHIGGGTVFEPMLKQILNRDNPTVIFTDMRATEGDLSKLSELADKLMVLTTNPEYKDKISLPYVQYVEC